MMYRVVGVDEVGRGPLAGPVTICAVAMANSLPKTFLRGIRNSKDLSAKAREIWYQKALQARRARHLDFAVSFAGPGYIDAHGITAAVRACIARALRRLDLIPTRVRVLLDGSLKAPARFRNQKTIIRGNERVPIIGLASVIAKVRRDRRMRRYAKQFRGYGFEEHVGYGTRAHYKAIRKLGMCVLHRRSFLTKIKKERSKIKIQIKNRTDNFF